MFKFLAPILGLAILLASLVTMPAVTAANGVSIPVHPPVEVPPSLTMIAMVHRLGDHMIRQFEQGAFAGDIAAIEHA